MRGKTHVLLYILPCFLYLGAVLFRCLVRTSVSRHNTELEAISLLGKHSNDGNPDDYKRESTRDPIPRPQMPHRMTSPTELLNLLLLQQQVNGTTPLVHQALDLLPIPLVSSDAIQVYNPRALMRLKKALRLLSPVSDDDDEYKDNSNNKRNEILICTLGGSATAGAYLLDLNHTFDRVWSRWIRTSVEINNNNNKVKVTALNRGHGMRGSIHSAFLMHSLIPTAACHVILWEFAINDQVSIGLSTQNPETWQRDAHNTLIFFLEQVRRIPTNQQQRTPPFVILVYLWDRPFQYNYRLQRYKQALYDAHAQVAREYDDFVLGHVNLAQYLAHSFLHPALAAENNNSNSNTTSVLASHVDAIRRIFLADEYHPSAWGHVAIAFLLQRLLLLQPLSTDSSNLTMTEATANVARINQKNRHYYGHTRDKTTPLPPLVWTCGNSTPGQRLVQQLLDRRHHPLPFASFTMELPRNEYNDSYSPHPGFLKLLTPDWPSQTHRANTIRLDRVQSITLPCCDSRANSNEAVLSLALPKGTRAFVSGMNLALEPSRYLDAVQVLLDDNYHYEENNETNSIAYTRVSSEGWSCIFGGRCKWLQGWIVWHNNNKNDSSLLSWATPFLRKKNVSQIHFCNRHCSNNIRVGLVSVAVFGTTLS